MDFSTKVAIFLVQFSAILVAIAIFFYRNSSQGFYTSFMDKFSIFIAASTMLGGAIISFMNGTLDSIAIAYGLLFIYRIVGLFPYRY